MSQEIELKLSLPAHALAALRRHPLISAAPRVGRAVTLDNTYYDTAELTLKAHKVAVRTRRQGRKWLQTVKCAAVSSGGLSHRPEWEGPYGGAFDFSAVDDADTAKLLARHHSRLEPVFTTRFRRETHRYTPREGVDILLMIDAGQVLARTRETPICELELELVEGSPLDLLELACTLARDLPLIPNDVSKAERGYRLFLDQPELPARSVPSLLKPGEDVLDAFGKLAFGCLRQWQANAHAIAEGRDGPEFVHQLRVALRRLRSLLRLFAPALPDGFAAEWNARLRDNANLMGEARNLDVLHDELLAPVCADELVDEKTDIAGLLVLARAARDGARRTALNNLHASSQGLLILEFTAALHRLAQQGGPHPEPIKRFAATQLRRLRKRARRRFEACAELEPTTLHALRIAMKQLRYGTEFFAPLCRRKALESYLASLGKVQAVLGFLNDIDIARPRLGSFADGRRALDCAVAFVLGWHAPRYAEYRSQVLADVRPLLWGGTPW